MCSKNVLKRSRAERRTRHTKRFLCMYGCKEEEASRESSLKKIYDTIQKSANGMLAISTGILAKEKYVFDNHCPVLVCISRLGGKVLDGGLPAFLIVLVQVFLLRKFSEGEEIA